MRPTLTAVLLLLSVTAGCGRQEPPRPGVAEQVAREMRATVAIRVYGMRAAPSIVTILAGPLSGAPLPPGIRFETELCMGSGVAVDRRHVLTCWHVVSIDGQSRIGVDTADTVVAAGARVVAHDDKLDLALVEVDRDLPAAARWGRSATLRPGDYVTAVGFPFDLGKYASRGIVAGSRPRGADTPGRLVSDVAINPGSSGGGLYDDRGDLVGIADAIHVEAGVRVFVGVSYAVDGDDARAFVRRALVPAVTASR